MPKRIQIRSRNDINRLPENTVYCGRPKFSKIAAIAYRDGYEAACHRCLLQQRAKLADFLLLKCPVDALDDYELISDFVRRGESLEEILRFDGVSRWPEAEILLKALLGKESK